MTEGQAIDVCRKHKFIVNFHDELGQVSVMKMGSVWIGPEDVGGYGRCELHRIGRAKTFIGAVTVALESLPRWDFK